MGIILDGDHTLTRTLTLRRVSGVSKRQERDSDDEDGGERSTQLREVVSSTSFASGVFDKDTSKSALVVDEDEFDDDAFTKLDADTNIPKHVLLHLHAHKNMTVLE